MSYSWDKFLKPLSATDTNIQVQDDKGIVTHTINPYAVLNVLINNNIIKISIKSGKVITIPFSTMNESKMALPRIKQLIDSLNIKEPLFVDNELKKYVSIQISQSLQGLTSSQGPTGSQGMTGSQGPQGMTGSNPFFYQDNIPTGTGTNSIKVGTFWYDTEFGFLYVYINDEFSGYNWITAVGEVGPTGPTGPAHSFPSKKWININNPNNFVLFQYDSSIYNGASFNFVEVNTITGNSITYHLLAANNSNTSVNTQTYFVSSSAGGTQSTISATISGINIEIISNGSGTFNYSGHSQLF